MQVDIRCALAEVLSHPEYVVPGLPVLYCFSRASTDFLKEFKARNMKGGVKRLSYKG